MVYPLNSTHARGGYIPLSFVLMYSEIVAPKVCHAIKLHHASSMTKSTGSPILIDIAGRQSTIPWQSPPGSKGKWISSWHWPPSSHWFRPYGHLHCGGLWAAVAHCKPQIQLGGFVSSLYTTPPASFCIPIIRY